MFCGKNKALTFSYDDGVRQDIRLIEIFNKYGLKATFNLNSERFGHVGSVTKDGVTVDQTRVDRADVRSIYQGHEIAVHTLTHPNLVTLEDDAEVVRQVEQDRLNLSELAGYEILGMAYPGSKGGGPNCDERIVSLIRNETPIRYARVIARTKNFDPWPDLYRYRGTLYHHADWNMLFDMGRQFLELQTDTPKVFYIWGHAYEFDVFPERWQQFEEFCAMMSGRDDIFYGTNMEVLTAVDGKEKID